MVFIPLFCLPWLLSVFEEDEWDEVDQDDDDEDDDDDDKYSKGDFRQFPKGIYICNTSNP
jgi:hypothetical protein